MKVNEKYKGNITGPTVATRLRGQSLTVCANIGSHNYGPVGTVIKVITCVYAQSSGGVMLFKINGNSSYIRADELELQPIDKEALETEVVRLEEEILDLRSKLAYLKATKKDVFDDTEYKVWNTLQVLKTKKSDIQKAEVIARLINND